MSAFRLSVINAEVFRFPEPWTFPAAELPYSILRLIRSGTGEIAFDGLRRTVSPGDLVLIREGAVLACRATSPDFSFASIRFSASVDASGVVAGELPVPPVSDAGADPLVRSQVDAVIAAWEQRTPGRSLRASGHLAVALGRAADLAATHGPTAPAAVVAPPRPHTRVRDPRVTRIIEHLRADLRRTPDPESLCALAHMSESTLRRTFKDQTGKTIGAFLRELRMSAAARRLALSDEPVGEIADAVGLPDANYFARSFREVFRVTPSEYRRLARET